MLEILRIQTVQFTLTVWCASLEKRQQVYDKTLAKHGGVRNIYEIRFSPVTGLTTDPQVLGAPNGTLESTLDNCESIQLTEPLFFENLQYQFEWEFTGVNPESAKVVHRLKGINDGFRFSSGKSKRLVGTINTGNDVGWFRLPICYQIVAQEHRFDIAFEVLPTKMNLHSDLPAMYQTIDNTFPLWRFSLVQNTEQEVAKSNHRGDFPLHWLTNFALLRGKFEQGLKVIANAPHSRLQTNVVFIKADKLKGRLQHRLVENVKEDLANGQNSKRYRVEKKHLSVDTPENRFIKMVVGHCKSRLAIFESKLRETNRKQDGQRLSEVFLDEIAAWQLPLHKMQKQSFLREVGSFHGLSSESLVLQQKTGYSAVYRVWQELKFYLDVFSNQTTVSMKSVAEIYEVWCFLTIRNLLIDDLGFNERSPKRQPRLLKGDLEYQLKDGMAGAFEFDRPDGVTVTLAHEPVFRANKGDIQTYLLSQKPDILLKVSFPDGQKVTWLFDAKYRIKTDKGRFDVENIDDTDYVPDDAINQMHRYRDALIHIGKRTFSDAPFKTRPVFGAFALYPGSFDQTGKNPYQEAIEQVGIGAFALFPSPNPSEGRAWLTNFLKFQIGLEGKFTGSELHRDDLFIQETARIPFHGMKQALHSDLIFTVGLNDDSERDPEYLTAFVEGKAKYYHIPQATFTIKFRHHVAEEIRYLAIATRSVTDPTKRTIESIWPVQNIVLKPRNEISKEKTGRKELIRDDHYYLFKLGKPLRLSEPIVDVPTARFRDSMKLTTLSRIEKASAFSEIESVYEDALRK